jgi:hypothetical protein
MNKLVLPDNRVYFSKNISLYDFHPIIVEFTRTNKKKVYSIGFNLL